MDTTLTRLEPFRLFSLGQFTRTSSHVNYPNVHELKKAIRQKWNEIEDQDIKWYFAVAKASCGFLYFDMYGDVLLEIQNANVNNFVHISMNVYSHKNKIYI